MKKGNPSILKGVAAGHQHWVTYALSSGSMVVDAKTENERKISDGVLMVVTARIYGHPVRALIDSGANRCFISLSAVMALGLITIKNCTFLELGDGPKSSPKERWLMFP